MIQIGRYRFGFAPLSMIAVFIVLTACAVVASITQDMAFRYWDVMVVCSFRKWSNDIIICLAHVRMLV